MQKIFQANMGDGDMSGMLKEHLGGQCHCNGVNEESRSGRKQEAKSHDPCLD